MTHLLLLKGYHYPHSVEEETETQDGQRWWEMILEALSLPLSVWPAAPPGFQYSCTQTSGLCRGIWRTLCLVPWSPLGLELEPQGAAAPETYTPFPRDSPHPPGLWWLAVPKLTTWGHVDLRLPWGLPGVVRARTSRDSFLGRLSAHPQAERMLSGVPPSQSPTPAGPMSYGPVTSYTLCDLLCKHIPVNL